MILEMSLVIIIAMKIENEDALDDLVICPQCHTLHQGIIVL